MSNFLEDNKEDTKFNKRENHTIWVEKYRPTSLDNYIGNDLFKNKIKQCISENDIGHLLLYGKPGSGKTSVAKIIVNSISCDYLYINASDENNVDTVRNKIKGFASSVGFKDLKIIILDESDHLSMSSLAALRNIMETFSKTTRFIFTCNYVERIIEPIQSRCQTYQIVPPSKKEVAVYLKNILDNEKIKFEMEDFKCLIDSYYPDIRKIVNSAQSSVVKNELIIDKKNVVENDGKLKLIELLKSKKDNKTKFSEIRQLVANSHVNDFTDWYSFLYEKIEEYTTNVANIILILSESEYKSSFVVDKEITFMGCIVQILKEQK
jgi:DNA polymerase III delta prime subunit